MLPLPRHVGTREHDAGVLLPERVRVHLVLDPRLHRLRQLEHEVGPRSDAVGVEPAERTATEKQKTAKTEEEKNRRTYLRTEQDADVYNTWLVGGRLM